ncbi:MAG: peptidylprolyl isomerase [Verrucomicrobiales bacterium]
MKNPILAPLFVALFAGFTFAADEKKAAAPATSPPPSNPSVEMKTSKGLITIELNREKAPVTVENFLKYVEKKHYDGTVFHRVINDFMIQGGGFAKDGEKLVEKETAPPIKNEAANGLKNETGTIAMARTADPNSATAQFYINVKNNDNLNQAAGSVGYAVFGKVTKGMDVISQMKAVKTGLRPLTSRVGKNQFQAGPHPNVPLEDVIIESVRVIESAAAVPTKKSE